jgi:hypothetical protein
MNDLEEAKLPSSSQLKLRQRLEFIEFRLFWTGRLNRSDLIDQFRISPPQATNDIAEYQALAPDNLTYDLNSKNYVRSAVFVPNLIGRSIDRFLTQVVGIAQGWLQSEDTWFSSLPQVDVVSLDRRPTDPMVLLRVLDAINTRQEIAIDYCSMTGSPAIRRSVVPHAFGAAWGRWYVRAFSTEHGDFRDYALARISAVHDASPSAIDLSLDFEWHQKIDLVLVPNPLLDEDRQRAQRLEHRMDEGKLKVPCRLSMAFYLMAEHKLDIEPGVLSPYAQPLVLDNLVEVRQAREVARNLAKQALERAAST